MNISGVILAGGVNDRFSGKSKTDIMVDGKTIISRVIETINDIFVEIIIVANTPLKFNGFRNYLIVSDIFTKAGPCGGLHAGIKVSSKDAVFVFACDMPFLNKQLITR